MKYPDVAIRIREALEDKAMSAQELADAIGVNKSSVSQYVNGMYVPRSKRAREIADVLDVNPAWIMGLNVPKKLSVEIDKDNAIEYGISFSAILKDKKLTEIMNKVAMLETDEQKDYMLKTINMLLNSK